jgi:hypothetical protein
MTGYDAASDWSQSDPLLKSLSLLPLTRFANLAGHKISAHSEERCISAESRRRNGTPSSEQMCLLLALIGTSAWRLPTGVGRGNAGNPCFESSSSACMKYATHFVHPTSSHGRAGCNPVRDAVGIA